MDKDYLTQLTSDLYELTLLFPKKEPLRYKTRELADDILANILRAASSGNSERYYFEALEDLDILFSYFEIAKNQNWASPEYVLRIQEKYVKLIEEIKRAFEAEKGSIIRSDDVPLKESGEISNIGKEEINLSGQAIRQKKILDILKEKGRAQVWEFKKIFPEVTKRTLRRDFEYLVKREIVERIGEKNNTFYQFKVKSD